MKTLISIFILFIGINLYSQELKLEFEILHSFNSSTISKNGRLFIVFSKDKPTEIYSGIRYPDLKMNPIFGVDVLDWTTYNKLLLRGDEFYGFPLMNMENISDGNWYIYAVFSSNEINPNQKETKRVYSTPTLFTVNKNNLLNLIELNLDNILDDIEIPIDRKHYKYDSFPSKLLSEFWNKSMSLSCQIILPSSYYLDTERDYPILFMIGGFGTRYYDKVISEEELLDSNISQMIIVLLDSKAPFGDSYLINSANNGPYGDALVKEIIPQIESKYRCIGKSKSRFLTGTSTGGWSSLALQIYYPDFFNGVWSTCSDPVDFRQMELININEDNNAFVNRHGMERPAMRDINGEPRYSLKTEVWSENITGMRNSYSNSGGQWGSWNAVFSPRDSVTGLPNIIFNAETGIINKDVAEAWKKYDLRLYLFENWEEIGHEIEGKLHIWMGTADSYYLNNAMVLFDRFLKSTSNPISDANINFICGEGHACDSEIPLKLMMQQMLERMEKTIE